MNRRSFFAAAAGAASVLVTGKAMAADGGSWIGEIYVTPYCRFPFRGDIPCRFGQARGLRLSSMVDDPGHAAWLALPHRNTESPWVRTYLNGVEQTLVVTADEEEGFIYKGVPHPEDGGLQIDPNVPDTIWMEKVYGHVRIVLPS